MISIVREMRATMIHSAFSSAITELFDLSCAIFGRSGELIAQSEDNPQHILPIVWSIKEILRQFDSKIQEDDFFIHNDPYTGGLHLNDIAVVRPFFYEGELVFFPVVRAHWEDVGGMSRGSISGQASEIFQEGLRIPLIRLKLGSAEAEMFLKLIIANMRNPEEREGDFKAMLGTCEVARRRLNEVIRNYGAKECLAYVSDLIDREWGRMRSKIASLPDGVYSYEGYLDPRPDMDQTPCIQVKITIKEDKVSLDFTGSSPQMEGPWNIGPSGTPTGVFMMLKALVDPEGPVNSGSFKPISVHVPKGTFLNATPPSAFGAMGDVRRSVESVVMAALAAVLPERVTGDTKGTANQVLLSGIHPSTKESFLLYEAPAGGTGGFYSGDGNHTLRTFNEGDFTAIQPVEAIEHKFPLRVEECSLRTDSCGDGRYRGGLGMRRVIRFLAKKGSLSIVSDKNILPPYGLFGGTSGYTNSFKVIRNGESVTLSVIPGKVSNFPVFHGDQIIIESSGGGGYGDPLYRSPSLVNSDIRDGYISHDKARIIYGVVIDGEEIDLQKTEQQRSIIRGRRSLVLFEPGSVPDNPFRLPTCLLHPETAAKSGVISDAIAELFFVKNSVTPIRVIVLTDIEMDPKFFRLDTYIQEFYGILPEAPFWLRPLYLIGPNIP
jgi:N-methylhydantoinase B